MPMRPENRRAQWHARGIRRRTAIELGICLVLAPRVVCAQTDVKRERPREGDLLVAIDSTRPEPLKPDDVQPEGKLRMAWPLNPTDDTVRDGSRLNKVLLLRLDPESLDPVTRDRAAEGVVAYSAICTHVGCDVIVWHPESQRLECPCHYSQFDPVAAAKVREFQSTNRSRYSNGSGEAGMSKPQAAWAWARHRKEDHGGAPRYYRGPK